MSTNRSQWWRGPSRHPEVAKVRLELDWAPTGSGRNIFKKKIICRVLINLGACSTKKNLAKNGDSSLWTPKMSEEVGSSCLWALAEFDHLAVSVISEYVAGRVRGRGIAPGQRSLP